MTDLPDLDPLSFSPRPVRWQQLWQRSQEPIFLLNRRGRLIFVNQAWEQLTGLTADDVLGRKCRQHREFDHGSWEALAGALAPPPEVLEGRCVRARRLVTDPAGISRCWDVEFFPVTSGEGLLAILGKVTVAVAVEPPKGVPLPEELLALRDRVAQRFSLDLGSGPSRAQLRLNEQARLASRCDAPVWIQGEVGTGKRWLTRVIHFNGPTREKTLVILDGERLPPAVLAATLFGEVGWTRNPNLGTLYLHEPALWPRDIQARLAEWLPHRREGVRVVAGASQAPREMIESGRLAEELYARVAVLVIDLPPLRERRADLPELAAQFLERAQQGEEKPATGLSPEAEELLSRYSWPGNLPELLQVLAGAAERARGRAIDVADLPYALRQAVQLQDEPRPETPRSLPLEKILEQTERRLIELALRLARGNKSRAADLLRIHRPQLYHRLKALGIEAADE
ncbi:MAG: sigma 54-interacting transcriptional regulator [Gemmataceae bacterium]|nr:sigma 54-interacting transcriptional regulator [Gemmataceae bacterium]MDW8266255.1 sigma 54-interacting transcriptional regulator [Gemmataceae bacterium]